VQVFDEDVDPDHSISEKTVTLSVVEGKQMFIPKGARKANWLCRWFEDRGANTRWDPCCDS
jgi:uncharacterized protein YodC (DUF2158 family)